MRKLFVRKKWNAVFTLIAIAIVILLPFMVVSFWAFDFIKKDAAEMFDANLTRFTHNTAMESVNRQLEEIDVIFQIISNQITEESMEGFISPKPSQLDPILSTIVNSTFFFKRAIVMDNNNNYNVYPPDEVSQDFAVEQISHPYFAKKNKLIYSYFKNDTSKHGNMGYSATIGMNLYDSRAKKYGVVAFELDLETMSEPLRDIQAPFGGHFIVASKKGDVIMHPNSQEIFHRETPQRWLKQANEYEGNFYDEETNQYVYYHTFSLPAWVAFTVVDASEHEDFINRAPRSLMTIFIVCIILYIVIFSLCRIYYKQIVSRIYLGVRGVKVDDDSHSLNHVYDQITLNHQKLKAAEKLSSEDPLMAIATRRCFDATMEALITQQQPFHIAIIDLDNFKQINDTHGHQTGDEVLKYVAKVGKGLLDEGTTLYRYGGEELVVIFTQCTLETSLGMLESWRRIVALREWREVGLNVSFSGGIAAWRPGMDGETVLKRADQLLYHAKRLGKNNIQPENEGGK